MFQGEIDQSYPGIKGVEEEPIRDGLSQPLSESPKYIHPHVSAAQMYPLHRPISVLGLFLPRKTP